MIVSTRIDQLLQAALRLLHAPLAFEAERLRHHGHGQRAHLAGERGDDRRRARAGAAAETGGDEHHVRAFERLDDLVGIFERSLAPAFGIRARAQAIGQLDAELDLDRRARHLQRLQVGVGDHELHALDLASIMRLTALPPPPPTPITLILALLGTDRSSNSMRMSFLSIFSLIINPRG